MEFSSAGILFEESGEEEPRYLSGWNGKLQSWSGLGGKRRGAETAWQTALREVIEEVFGIHVKKETLDDLHENLTPLQFFQNGSYVCFVCPLSFLLKLSIYLEGFGYKSTFYIKFPTSVYELLESRTYVDVKHPEISDLTLLTLATDQPLDPYYKSDLEMVRSL